MLIVPSNICSAFAFTPVIGSKVLDPVRFVQELSREIRGHDHSTDRVPGQLSIRMHPSTFPLVSCGMGPRYQNREAYVLGHHRGHVGAYLKRRYAGSVQSLTCIVYARAAYFADPDVADDKIERGRLEADQNITHVLVAVLASPFLTSPYPEHTLMRNLAGANREALIWTADEIRAKCKESVEFWEKWAIVADEE